MWEFKVCLSVNPNICFRYKSLKKWSILIKLWYVFAGSNLNLGTKNCDRLLAFFYSDTSNSWIFVFIYVPLSISLYNNTNVTTTRILLRVISTTYSFEIRYRETREGFWQVLDAFCFTNILLEFFFSDICAS